MIRRSERGAEPQDVIEASGLKLFWDRDDELVIIAGGDCEDLAEAQTGRHAVVAAVGPECLDELAEGLQAAKRWYGVAPDEDPRALVMSEVLGLLERQAKCLHATLLPSRDAADVRMLKAIDTPRPGDWVLVAFATQPIDMRVGRLIATGSGPDGPTWTIEDVRGRLWSWSNCEVRRLLATGNPYAGSFVDEPNPAGETWAADRRAAIGCAKLAAPSVGG